MKLASIAFWENPPETAAYAVLYLILCVFNYVTRAVVRDRVVSQAMLLFSLRLYN
jgi:hypothetical protein